VKERLLYLLDDLCGVVKVHIEAQGKLDPEDYVFVDLRTSKPVEPRHLHTLIESRAKGGRAEPGDALSQRPALGSQLDTGGRCSTARGDGHFEP
jgi:hypothetical protein